MQTVYCKKYRDKNRTKSNQLGLDLIFELNKNEELKARANQIENEMAQIRLELLDIHPDIDFTAIFMEKYLVNKDFDMGQLVKSTIEKCCGRAIIDKPVNTTDLLDIAMDAIRDDIPEEIAINATEEPIASEMPIAIENISFCDYID